MSFKTLVVYEYLRNYLSNFFSHMFRTSYIYTDFFFLWHSSKYVILNFVNVYLAKKISMCKR